MQRISHNDVFEWRCGIKVKCKNDDLKKENAVCCGYFMTTVHKTVVQRKLKLEMEFFDFQSLANISFPTWKGSPIHFNIKSTCASCAVVAAYLCVDSKKIISLICVHSSLLPN